MSIPITPAQLLAVIPQTTQDPCDAMAKALIANPKLIYDFFEWAIKADGSTFTNEFISEIWDVGDFKYSANNGLDTGLATSRWLLCDGRTVNQADFPALYAEIGTTYGPAAGLTFTLPDFRGKFPLAVSGSYAIGTSGGAATHTLDEDEIPAHTHQIQIETDTGGADTNQSLAVQGDGSAFQTFTTDSFGGGGSHNNMPPYLVGGYMYIKT